MTRLLGELGGAVRFEQPVPYQPASGARKWLSFRAVQPSAVDAKLARIVKQARSVARGQASVLSSNLACALELTSWPAGTLGRSKSFRSGAAMQVAPPAREPSMRRAGWPTHLRRAPVTKGACCQAILHAR